MTCGHSDIRERSKEGDRERVRDRGIEGDGEMRERGESGS